MNKYNTTMNTTERRIQQLKNNTPKNTALYVLTTYADSYIHNKNERTKDDLKRQFLFCSFVYPEQLTDVIDTINELLNNE